MVPNAICSQSTVSFLFISNTSYKILKYFFYNLFLIKCNQLEKFDNIYMKDVFDKELKSKLENKKIYNYIENNKLKIKQIMNEYTNYIHKIVKNHSLNLTTEDVEEITLDVFLTLWRNTSKLDINSSLPAYIRGVTKNLIKLKYREIKIADNIDDYEDTIIDFSNIEIVLSNNEKYAIVMDELNKIKKEDKNIFISYYNDEIKIKELSKIYNMSESKIKSKLFRVRKMINKKLKERGYGING